MIDEIQKRLLREVADLHDVPEGAYNIRANGQMAGRHTTANIEITTKKDVNGIDIRIKPGTKHESVHIPVVVSESGLKEMVYNDFYIGDDADVVIVAGCGINNCGDQDSEHDGIHRFFFFNNAKVKYVEKHYGEGDGRGKRILNPVTEAHMDENSYMEMETTQIKGVDSTIRDTKAELGDGATLIIKEKIMGRQLHPGKNQSREFAEELGVSNTPIRKAVSMRWQRKGCRRQPQRQSAGGRLYRGKLRPAQRNLRAAG